MTISNSRTEEQSVRSQLNNNGEVWVQKLPVAYWPCPRKNTGADKECTGQMEANAHCPLPESEIQGLSWLWCSNRKLPISEKEGAGNFERSSDSYGSTPYYTEF
jgi:hypothetical protein